MNKPTKSEDAELQAIDQSLKLFQTILNVAAQSLLPAAAEALYRRVDSGDADLHMTCVWGPAGMRLRADAVDAAGNAVAILNVFLPASGSGAEPDESSNQAGTPPALH